MQKIKYFSRLTLFYFLFNSFISTICAQQLLDDLILSNPVNVLEDFEEGHTNGWESYPPSQDTGFDPNFLCERTDGIEGSKYSLLLNYPSTFETTYEMGFIKRFSLIASEDLKISFDYKSEGFGSFTDMDVVLCGLDGNQYSYNIPVKDDGYWTSVSASLKDFNNVGRQIKPSTGIDGFYIMARIPQTNPSITYKLYFDNLVIESLEPTKLRIKKPVSEHLINFHRIIPSRHYSIGDNLNLVAELNHEINLELVNIKLIDPGGKIILENLPLSLDKSTNEWSKEYIYSFSNKDLLGRWEIELTGQNETGKFIKTNFHIWLTDKRYSHPKIYFDEEGIKYLKEKIKDERWNGWWNTLVVSTENLRKTLNLGSLEEPTDTSESSLIEWTLKSLAEVNIGIYDTIYLLPTLGHYFNIMVPARNVLHNNALIYALTGDKTAGEYAKKALLIISQWDTWTHPWFNARHRETYYPVGELGVHAAFCYDLIYPLMNEYERKIVQEGFLKNCIIPAYQEYVVENRIPSATSNWIGHVVSGGLSCALAIYRDDPELNLEPYISGLIFKMEDLINSTLGAEGAWGEGIGYQGFAYSTVLPTITVLNNVLNYNLAGKDLLNSYKYFLYNFSDPEVLDVGDSHPGLTTLSNYALLSGNSDDELFQWLYLKSPRRNMLDFLFGDDNKPSESPDKNLPLNTIFTDIGSVVFRSGWQPDDIVLNFRSGPFYNHQHFDQGSFQLRAFGENIIPEAGWATYYTEPWYPRYYIQPVGHNTILLDGDAGSQRSGDYLDFIKSGKNQAEIVDFISTDFYSAANGEISGVYRGKLDKFERNIIFIDQKYFIIYDKLRSSGENYEYDWLLHFNDSKEVESNKDNSFYYNTKKASLYAQILFPENIQSKIVEGPIKLDVPIKKPGYIQINNIEKKSEENFLVILYPSKDSSTISDLNSKVQKTNGENFIGFNLSDRKFYFKTAQGSINTEKFSTDGNIASLTIENNTLINFAVHNATGFVYEGKKLFESDTPVTVAVNQDQSEWNISSNGNGEVELLVSSKPKFVLVNGEQINNFLINNGEIKFRVSKRN